MYMLPYCTPESMKKPETKEMFVTGPVGMVVLRPAGPMNIGAYLGQWFVYSLVISFLSAFLAWHVLGNGTPFSHVFHIVTLAAFLGLCHGRAAEFDLVGATRGSAPSSTSLMA